MRSLVVVFLLISANIFAQKGDRIMAWQIDVSENDDYDSAWVQAERACMESTHFFLAWGDLEGDTGVYDTSVIHGYLDILDLYLSFKNTPIEFVVAPINTVKREVPSELENVDFDDPVMIRHFKRALDTIFFHLQNVDMSLFNIGNESDGYLGTDPTAYAQYKTFLDSVIPHAKSLYQQYRGKNLKVGTTLMHGGLTDAVRGPLCKTLNSGLDVVSVTYYPLNPDFTMESPNVVDADFDTLVQIYSDTSQPIYFVECGYSSSPVCNSSQALQASFYEAVFTSWDEHQENIRYISVFKLHDWSLEECQELSDYYGVTDTAFIEYLHGLGVREWFGDGTDKDAMKAIKCELEARSWCITTCEPWSVQEIENDLVKIFPNPSDGIIYLDLESGSEQFELEVFNMAGQILERPLRLNAGRNTIDLPDIPGLYLLIVKSESGNQKVFRIMRE